MLQISLPRISNKVVIFIITLIGCGIDIINVSAAILSTSTIANKYSISTALASWTLSAYAVTFCGFIAFLGRVGDVVGHTTLFSISGFAFALCSLLCAVINNIYGLIIFRAFQGVSAAGIVPSGYAIISHTFEGKHKNRALAFLGSVFSVSFGIGFIIGGAFEETTVGYKGVFYVSFALVFIVAILSLMFEGIKPSGSSIKSLDFPGCLLFVGGAVLVVCGLTEGGESWKSARAIAPLIVGVFFLLLFFTWNSYVADLPIITERYPRLKQVSLLIPKEIWTTRNSVPVLIALLLNYIGVFGHLLLIALNSELVEGNSPLLSALKTLPSVLAMIVGTTVLSLKHHVLTDQAAFLIGYGIMTVGSIILVFMPQVQNSFWKIILVSEVLISGGSAIFFTYCQTYLIGNARLEVKGIMSGVSQTFAQFGSALAFSIIASIMGNSRNVSREVIKQRVQNATYLFVTVLPLGFVLMLLVVLRDFMRSSETDTQTEASLEAKLDQNSSS